MAKATQRLIRVLFLAALTSCASDPLPTYPTLDAPQVERILAERTSAIHTISGQCALTAVRGDGQTIHLDSVIAAAPPDRLRLRAWKMNQAVFDLTVRPDGVWIEIPGQAPDKNNVLPATLRTAQIARDLLWFSGGFFTSPGLIAQDANSDPLIFRRPMENGSEMLCRVDRRTLLARQYRVIDSAGVVQFTIDLDEYRVFPGNIVWPTHLRANNLSDHTRIELSLSGLRFNQELPPNALTPPPHAEKRP
jgi:hypothetical protein